MSSLTVVDLLRAGDFDAAINRMQALCRAADPEIPVDADQVRAEFEAARDRLRPLLPPAPFRIVVERMKA